MIKLSKGLNILSFKHIFVLPSVKRAVIEKEKFYSQESLRFSNFLHLFLKESSLYTGLEDFLALFLRCLVKTHAEGVAESMDIEDIGIEAFIHWNGPPLHLADKLGMESLDSHFGGRRRWNFVTLANKTDSTVIKRLKKVEAKVPFFT